MRNSANVDTQETPATENDKPSSTNSEKNTYQHINMKTNQVYGLTKTEAGHWWRNLQRPLAQMHNWNRSQNTVFPNCLTLTIYYFVPYKNTESLIQGNKNSL